MFVAALFITAKNWKLSNWVSKSNVVYSMECYLAIKKNEVLIHGHNVSET